jgi:hypothetical protein
VRPWKKVLPFVPLSVTSPPDKLVLFAFPILLHANRVTRCDLHRVVTMPHPLLPHLSHTIAGVRGTITRYVITIPTPAATYHFYELDVIGLEKDWLEGHERRREWVDYAEAVRRLEWKSELAQGLKSSSLASR